MFFRIFFLIFFYAELFEHMTLFPESKYYNQFKPYFILRVVIDFGIYM